MDEAFQFWTHPENAQATPLLLSNRESYAPSKSKWATGTTLSSKEDPYKSTKYYVNRTHNTPQLSSHVDRSPRLYSCYPVVAERKVWSLVSVGVSNSNNSCLLSITNQTAQASISNTRRGWEISQNECPVTVCFTITNPLNDDENSRMFSN